jgi:hypothetical protein
LIEEMFDDADRWLVSEFPSVMACQALENLSILNFAPGNVLAGATFL